MADNQYEYVTCDCCGSEARKERQGVYGGGSYCSPPGWAHTTNRDHKKLWDLCPECHKALTAWLLERAKDLASNPLGQALAQEDRPHVTESPFADGEYDR